MRFVLTKKVSTGDAETMSAMVKIRGTTEIPSGRGR